MLQGQKQQMAFTTYDQPHASGFGTRQGLQSSLQQQSQTVLGASARHNHEYPRDTQYKKPANLGPQNIYGNMSNKLQKTSSQSKFLSKSPGPQKQMMNNTGYGKFKGVQPVS